MDTSRHISVLLESGTALAGAAEGHLDRPVPSCPEWNVADLVWHTGEVHHFWRGIASGRLADHRDYAEPERFGGDALLAWYREGLEETARVLSALDPSAYRWTWAPQKDGAFIQRRMAQETLVHAWDARDAVGRAADLPADAAADGVSEFLEFMLPQGGDPPDGLDGNVLLRAADSGEVWTVGPAEGAWCVRRTEEEAVSGAEGTASDLLLLLWGRIGPSRVRTVGDGDVLTRFLSAAETE